MKGAEVALVAGFRAKVGSSDACDVVLADGALAEQAFELDVTDEAVTLLGADGEAKAVPAFTVFRFGSSAFAVGPASGDWDELKEPAAESAEESEGGPAAEAASDASPAADAAADAAGVEDGGRPPEGGGSEAASGPRRRRGLVASVVALALLLVLALVAWLFWPRLAAACPACKTSAAWASSACGWVRGLFVTPPPPPPPPPIPLSGIAAQHGLKLGTRNGRPLLTGNVRLRTERQAIRALALASDPTTCFDLTDDESLRESATELLFVVTEGGLFATAASNRVVTLAGYVPDAAHLETALRALGADVPGIEGLLTKDVQVGGTPPRPRGAPVAAPEAPRLAVAERKKAAVRAYAIAGILTKPYPCLVMRNGARLTEGAQVDGAVIEKIEVDKLTLRDGKMTVEWRP